MEICQKVLPASLPMQEELLIMDMAAEPRLVAGVLCSLRSAGESKPAPISGGFVRVERQTLRMLPRTGAVIFASTLTLSAGIS